jgi:hypothetical protein
VLWTFASDGGGDFQEEAVIGWFGTPSREHLVADNSYTFQRGTHFGGLAAYDGGVVWGRWHAKLRNPDCLAYDQRCRFRLDHGGVEHVSADRGVVRGAPPAAEIAAEGGRVAIATFSRKQDRPVADTIEVRSIAGGGVLARFPLGPRRSDPMLGLAGRDVVVLSSRRTAFTLELRRLPRGAVARSYGLPLRKQFDFPHFLRVWRGRVVIASRERIVCVSLATGRARILYDPERGQADITGLGVARDTVFWAEYGGVLSTPLGC